VSRDFGSSDCIGIIRAERRETMSKLTEEQLAECARLSVAAERAVKSMPQLVEKYPELTREEGYVIQGIREKMVVAEGHKVIGYKMGATSMEKRRQMGSTMPSFGRLFEYMMLEGNKPLSMRELIHPKVEPEITFVLKEDLSGPNMNSAKVMHATDYVIASLEIIDSRYHGFKFTGPDAVADNISGARFKLGSVKISPLDLDLELLGVRMSINGEDVAFGTGAAVLGHPARAVAALVNMLHMTGEKLRAGQLVMTGAITASQPLKAGDKVVAEFASLGPVTLNVVD
jgi:2-oxo-3-hexenedioate decarboxylase